jgi:uncharacterized membrane protein YphA (DoxX/SURF4 family)
MAQPLHADSGATYAPHTFVAGKTDHAYTAFQILRFGFAALPILAGLDKFFHYMVNWNMYLAPTVTQTLNIPAGTFMMGVGVVEIVAGLLVAFAPRIGGYLVAVWLWGIIVNLLIHPNRFYDVAFRDFGLSLGALALAQLATHVQRRQI